MKDLYKVTYQISDKGVDYPVREEEITVSKNKTVSASLRTQLNKYRHAMCLSTKFTVKIVSQYQSGWSN
jgi:hypothetical protein